MIRMLFVIGLLICCFALHAFEERTFETPKAEALYTDLIAELRCLVCQNQNIADSNADLAVDLRREIYTMITAGNSRKQIIEFMVDRYGEFVLYKPRLTTRTLLLWTAPFLLLLSGGFIVWRITTNGQRSTVAGPDEASLARARSLLDKED